MRVAGNEAPHSTIAPVSEKTGRSGRLVFVTVQHKISDTQGGFNGILDDTKIQESLAAVTLPLTMPHKLRLLDTAGFYTGLLAFMRQFHPPGLAADAAAASGPGRAAARIQPPHRAIAVERPRSGHT